MLHEDEDYQLRERPIDDLQVLKQKLVRLGGNLSQSITRNEQILSMTSSISEKFEQQEATINRLTRELEAAKSKIKELGG